MPRAPIALLMSVMLLAAGCARKKQIAVLPPPPKPVAPAAPQIPPLSIPQTQVQLPSPQPVDPRALATIEAPSEPLPPGVTTPKDVPAPLRRPLPHPSSAQGSAAAPPKPAETPTEAPVAAGELPRLQEILPPGEESELQARVAARRREALETMNQFRQPRNESERVAVGRIKSFLDLTEQALKRRDMRQADVLSELAVIVARELKGAK